MLIAIHFGCQQNTTSSVQTISVLPEKEIVFEGLNKPWSIAFLSEDEALVAEKNGTMVKVNLATKTKKAITLRLLDTLTGPKPM